MSREDNSDERSSAFKMQKIIDVNVGGKKFTTSRRTLAKSPFFKALLSGRWEIETTKQAEIFVDRDHTYFDNILNVLRGDRPSLVGKSIHYLVELLKEALFYGVEIEIEDLAKQFVYCRFCLKIFNEKMIRTLWKYHMEDSESGKITDVIAKGTTAYYDHRGVRGWRGSEQFKQTRAYELPRFGELCERRKEQQHHFCPLPDNAKGHDLWWRIYVAAESPKCAVVQKIGDWVEEEKEKGNSKENENEEEEH